MNLTANNSVDFIDYADFSELRAKNGSFTIFVTNNSTDSEGKNPLSRINYEYTANNIANDTNIMILGKNVRIIHYKQYSDQTFNGEMTWAYFKVNDLDVAIGWAGDTVDTYVIESFFNLN